MSDLITGKWPNTPKTNLVKNITKSVYFNQYSITQCTQNTISRIANIACMHSSLENYHFHQEKDYYRILHRVSTVITGPITSLFERNWIK